MKAVLIGTFLLAVASAEKLATKTAVERDDIDDDGDDDFHVGITASGSTSTSGGFTFPPGSDATTIAAAFAAWLALAGNASAASPGLQEYITTLTNPATTPADANRAALEFSAAVQAEMRSKPNSEGNKYGEVTTVPAACLSSGNTCAVFDNCLSLCPGRRGLTSDRCVKMHAMGQRYGNSSIKTNVTIELAAYVNNMLSCYTNRTVADVTTLHKGRGKTTIGNMCSSLKDVVADAFTECVGSPKKKADLPALCNLTCASQALLLSGSDGSIINSHWKGVSAKGKQLLKRCDDNGRPACMPYVFKAAKGTIAATIERIRAKMEAKFGKGKFIVQTLPEGFEVSAEAEAEVSRRAASDEEYLLVGGETSAENYDSTQASVYSEVCAGASNCEYGTVDGATPEDDDGSGTSAVVAIIIIIVCVVLWCAVLIAAAVYFFVIRRRSKTHSTKSTEHHTETHHTTTTTTV